MLTRATVGSALPRHGPDTRSVNGTRSAMAHDAGQVCNLLIATGVPSPGPRHIPRTELNSKPHRTEHGMTQSPFARQPSAQREAPVPAATPTATAPTQTTGGRFAVKRERPDSFPKANDLMPATAKGTDGALVIVRVERVTRDLKSQTGGTYDRFETKTWILDAPRGLPQHVLEAGEQRDGAYYLPEMGWSGAGLARDLEGPYENRQLFVGRVSSYKNNFGKLSPEFAMATDAELAQAEAYLAAHPEVDFPKTTFARAS